MFHWTAICNSLDMIYCNHLLETMPLICKWMADRGAMFDTTNTIRA